MKKQEGTCSALDLSFRRIMLLQASRIFLEEVLSPATMKSALSLQ